SPRTARLSFWCYLGGVIALPIGLYRVWLPALAAGGLFLLLAFGLYVGVVGVTLRRAPRRDVVAWHIAVALVGAAGGAIYGPILAINKGTGFLGAGTLDTLAAHASLMLGGWVAVLLMGVAYRLVGMFTLAEDALWLPGAWAGLGLTAGGAWLLSTNLHLAGPRSVNLAGAAALLAGLVSFGGQLVRLHRRRRRRGIDVHAPFALTAAACAIAAAALLTLGIARDLGPSASVWIVVGWLAVAGMAETAIQGFFYKIATFLVWLHRYAPLAGRQRVPKLEDLYSRRLALTGWALWTIGVALEAGAIGTAAGWLSRVAGLFVAVGLGCFLANVARIAGAWRVPAGGTGHPGPGRRYPPIAATVPVTIAVPRRLP
ncbi:MAG TPA: hypothetical protein VFU81_19050, partial [Thermomicrobiales bacterium]|nr:hypothetical protein [Thermomicrobiales bacterium]